jgi:iron complex transport system permease protein
LLILLASLLLNVCLGDVGLNLNQAMDSLSLGPQSDNPLAQVLWQVRLPRLLCALLTGTALSVSGYLLQALSRNSLADPYLTGVSSGAGLAVAISMVAGLSFNLLPIAALAGGLLASLLVAFMARTPAGLSVTRLLLAGVAVSAVCGSLITLIVTSSALSAGVQGLFFWLAGSVNGKSWAEFYPASIYVAVGVVAALLMSKPLRVLSLGTHSASALGLNVAVTQWLVLLIAVVLCGAAVSLSGIVGFVGLIAPYLSRRLFGSDERLHVITTACLGGILVLLSDLAARTAAGGQELPLGTLLSLVGAPFFLFLIVAQKEENI